MQHTILSITLDVVYLWICWKICSIFPVIVTLFHIHVNVILTFFPHTHSRHSTTHLTVTRLVYCFHLSSFNCRFSCFEKGASHENVHLFCILPQKFAFLNLSTVWMFCLPCFAVQLILVFSKERNCALGLSEQTKGICRNRSADVTCKTRETITHIRMASNNWAYV